MVLVIGLSAVAFFGFFKEDHGFKLVSGVSSSVLVQKNDEGIIHIKADNREDLFFAQGYVSAQYRLLQMMIMRQTFEGRMSEIVGKKALPLDEYMRILGLAKAAKSSYQHLSPKSKRYLEMYAKGVNEYMQDHSLNTEFKVLGFHPEAWKPSDAVTIAKAMSWNLGRNWTYKYSNSYVRHHDGIDTFDRLYPAYGEMEQATVSKKELLEFGLPITKESFKQRFPDSPPISQEDLKLFEPFIAKDVTLIEKLFSGETRQPGSNAWAINASNSISKHPLIANDPHLDMTVPGTFYLVKLESPEGTISGGAMPGAPYVIIGHNDHVAWGLTNSHADQSDLQICYSCSKGSVRKEIILVKGGESKELLIKDIKNGRIVGENGSKQARFLWLGLNEKDSTLESLFKINEAASVKEAFRASHDWISPSQNLVIIDRQHVGYRLLGKVPSRQYSGRFITSNYWQGYIPQRQMPFLIDPKKGFVANANNVIASPSYLYNLNGLEYDNVRQFRLHESLSRNNLLLSVADQKKLQMDVKDQEWVLLKDLLMRLKPQEELEKKAYDSLQKWNGMAELDSVGITIYSQWIREISKAMYTDFNDRPAYHQPRYNVDYIKNRLNDGGRMGQYSSSQEMLEKTFHAAVLHLANNLGTNVYHWKWKYVHKAFFRHTVFGKVPYLGYWFNRSIPSSGSRETLNRSRWFGKTKWFDAVEGPVIRLVVDAASFQHDQMMIAPGQSGSIFSSHYDDLLSSWAHGSFIDVARWVNGTSDKLKLMPKES